MNTTYNRILVENTDNVRSGQRDYSRLTAILGVLALLCSIIGSVVRSRVFRVASVAVCFVCFIGLVGAVEAGSLTFGAAFLITLPLAVVEFFCLR